MSAFNSTSNSLKMGILGCANIARQFIRDVKPSSHVVIRAVASRCAEKARNFAAENDVAYSYGSYEALLRDESIDAIYLPLPNSMHAEWSIKAAEAGKHVLCEKPLALSRNEAQSMFNAAERNNVILLESYPFWFQPQTGAMLNLILDGSIGAVRSVHASFGFTVSNPNTNIRLRPDLGGGALLDAGSYPLGLIRLIMGCAPRSVSAFSTMTEAGVDMSTMAILEYADGRRTQFTCAMDSANHRHATVVGTDGVIYTEYLNHTSNDPKGNINGYLPSLMRIRRGIAGTVPFEDLVSPSGSGFSFAAEAFSRLVQERKMHASKVYTAVSIDIAATLEAIRNSARIGQSVSLMP